MDGSICKSWKRMNIILFWDICNASVFSLFYFTLLLIQKFHTKLFLLTFFKEIKGWKMLCNFQLFLSKNSLLAMF